MSVALTLSSAHRRCHRWGCLRTCALATALVLAIGACKDEAGPAAQPGQSAAQQQNPQAAAVPAVSAQVAAMSIDQLREAARLAQSEQRIYAPAGNNAMEYYLALRDKQPSDASVVSALTDLMPYALIASEQSIARDDFVEAQRLNALIEKTDKAAPALPRLKQSLVDAQTSLAQRQALAERQSAAEQERLVKQDEERKKKQEEERKKAQEATQQASAQQQAAQQQTTQQQQATQAQREAAEREAAQREAAQREAAQREAAQRETVQREAERRTAEQSAAASSNTLRAISTPPPKYPTDALRSGQAGEVLIEFTVATDGSVSSARVVRSNPPRVFDREAVAAVRRWRFQPVAAPVTSRRNIGFKPGT